MRLFKRSKKKTPDEPAPEETAAPESNEEPGQEPSQELRQEEPPQDSEPKEDASEALALTEAGEEADSQPEPPEDEEQAAPEHTPRDEAETDQPEVAKTGFFGRLAKRLGKTKDKISGSIDRIAVGRKIDDELLDELEEVLVTADMGVETSVELIEEIRRQVRRKELKDAQALKKALSQGMQNIFTQVSPVPDRHQNNPHVILVVGVNGVGKTTTIGKLAHHFKGQGRKVLLGAADTFRAAAAEQLEVWSQRAQVPLVSQQHGADPSAVAFDTVEAAQSRGRDLVIIDTAGRLQTKVNLMEELKKINRVVGKKLPGAPHEVILVLDATTGQNALSQAKLFNEAVPLSGLILTKLDGTAKGGIVVAIAAQMKLPILFVGLGEGVEDLRPFDAAEFTEAIF